MADALVVAAEDVKGFLSDIEQASLDGGVFAERKQRNYDVRHALWAGQSPDGRKRGAALGKNPFPWEGASDTRLRLADALVNESVSLLTNAFFKAKVQLQPVESGDAAARVSAEVALRWMLWQHCADDFRREVELLANYQEQYGLALMHVTWRRTTRTERKQLTLQEIGEMLVESRNPVFQVLLDSIMDAGQEADAVALLRDVIGPEAATVAVVRALREVGVAEYDRPYIFENRPEFVALEPWEDVFFPVETSDLQRSRWIAWRELVGETELRERVLTEGYDEAWVDDAVKRKGVSRGGLGNYFLADRGVVQGESDLIELWHYYFRDSGPDGATRVRYCVLHSEIADRAGLADLVPFAHGQYPFVEFARERTSRCLLESRGIPEIVESAQNEIKVQRDYRADRSSIAVLPPVRVPANRGKLSLVFGPGAQIAERRPNEFGWMQPPPFDQGTIEVEASTRRDVDGYFGRISANVPQSLTMLMQQTAVDRWLRSCKAVVQQAFALMQQYLTDVEVMRVTGTMTTPFQLSREAIQGRFDLTADFDVRDLDAETLAAKLDFIVKMIVPLDVAGVLDRAGLVEFAMGAIDPGLAARLVRSQEAATAAEAEDEQLAFTKIAAGTEPALPQQGQNAQLRAQVLQGIVQANPQVQERFAKDEIFRRMIEARLQAFQFQIQQSQNAQIGRVGAVPVLQGLQGGNG